MPINEAEMRSPIVATARAFAYLRVSSDGQVRTGFSDDGLSIDAQREGARDKAAQLGVEIVAEYGDPGKSAYVDLHKRTGFLAMLEDLKERNRHDATRVDYVIVWALSRWARNTVDHWQTRAIIREAGARLISITEPMAGEDTAAAFLYESMVAANNQYQSMQTGENVRRGLRQKASVGGTYGPAKLGYLNAIEVMPDGRRVKTVKIDEARGPFVTLGFQLYASGEYSVSQLTAELNTLGLRSLANRRWPPGPLSASAVYRMLRNRYYLGEIVYKVGTPDETVFPGRHEPLIDQDTFDRVQELLELKRVAMERPQKRQHYLRGTLFCAECGSRLAYALSTGQNGRKYAYYFCMGRVNKNGCVQRANMRPELIEDAIADLYGREPIKMTGERVKRAKGAVRALAEISQEALRQVRDAKTALIDKLTEQQRRLIRMHLEEGDDVSPDAFREERARLQAEIDAAKESLSNTDARLSIDVGQVEQALELIEDVRAVYLGADPQTRRGYNQAFFKKLLVRAEWDEELRTGVVKVERAELTEPYALLLAEGAAENIEAEVAAFQNGTYNAESDPRESLSGVSYFVQMAEGEGFEPSRPVNPA